MKVLNFIKKHVFEVICLIMAILALMPIPAYQFYVLQRGLQNTVAVFSLVVLLGYTGLMSLGHAGFLAFGAYVYGILSAAPGGQIPGLGLNPWIALIIASVLSAAIGALIAVPSFKLSGPFLVVCTIAFGEIVRLVILNEIWLTRGPYGLNVKNTLFANPKGKGYYIFLVIIVLLIGIGVRRLKTSRVGLAWRSIKEDEVAAEIIGVDVRRYKLISFSTSSFLAGLSGVLLANLIGYLNPDSFTQAEGATYLLMTVLGGMSNVAGALLSSLAVTALPELLRFLQNSRLVVYSFLLIIIIRFFKQFENIGAKLEDRRRTKEMKTNTAGGGE